MQAGASKKEEGLAVTNVWIVARKNMELSVGLLAVSGSNLGQKERRGIWGRQKEAGVGRISVELHGWIPHSGVQPISQPRRGVSAIKWDSGGWHESE